MDFSKFFSVFVQSLAIVQSVVINAACAPKIGHVEPEMQPYFDSYEEEGEKRNKHPDVRPVDGEFVDDFKDYKEANPDTVGLCDYHTKSVKILKSYWKKAKDADREIIIYHELGHCASFKDHAETCPNIMCAYVPDGTFYLPNKKSMLDKLFE